MTSVQTWMDFVRARERALVLALCALVLAAGTIYSFALGPELPFLDEQDYHRIAQNLAAKGIFSADGETPTARRQPVYPALLAPLLGLGAGAPVLRIVNFVALALTIYLVALLARRLAGPGAGLLAALLTAGYPVLFYAAGALFPQTIGGLMFVLILFLLLRERSPSRAALLTIGALFGVLMLTISTFVFQLLVVLGWVVLTRWARPARALAALLIPAALLIGLWSARNYLAFDTFMLFGSNAGFNLFVGNYQGADPNLNPAEYLADLDEQIAGAEGLDEVEADAYFRDRAIAFFVQHPGEALRLYGLKLLNYFNYQNSIYAPDQRSTASDMVMLATYGSLLGLFGLRLALLRRFKAGPVELLLIGLYLTNAPFAAIFFTKIRYRLPFDLLLIVIVALFLVRVAGALAARRAARAARSSPAY